MRYAVLLGAFLLVCVGATNARPLPDGGVTIEEVATVMRAMDLNAEIGKDGGGDPQIRSENKGSAFYVHFYACKDGRCESIQFSEGFDLDDGISCEQMDKWNREWRYGRAFRDSENDPFLQMDIDLARGGTTEAITNNLELWLMLLDEFSKHIGFQSGSAITT